MLNLNKDKTIGKQFKNCAITILGTHHDLEYKDRDISKKGKNQILSLLNKVIPDLIVIEQGYHDQLLNEFGGRPADDSQIKRAKEMHWAAIWARDNKIKARFADLDENLEIGTRKKSCWLKREEAISMEILRSIQDGYKKIILFCGKKHVNSIKKMIEVHVDVDIKYINKEE